MANEISTSGRTVEEAKARKFMDLVKDGVPPNTAAEEVGVSLATLKRKGALATACRELLERTEAEKLLDKKTLELVTKGRALELAMQEDDLKVALGAVKVLTGSGPQVAVQINNNLRTNPAVVEALQSLQLDVERDDEE